VFGNDQHRGAEPDLAGKGRHIAEQGQRFEHVGLPDDLGLGPEAVQAGLLGPYSHCLDGLQVDGGLDEHLRKHEAEVDRESSRHGRRSSLSSTGSPVRKPGT
jgi:hypothetical protein